MSKSRKNAMTIQRSILYPSILIVVISILIASLTAYFNFRDSTGEIVQDSSKEINKQIILNFENYIDSVIDTANYIQQKTIEYGLQNQTNELDDIYQQAAEVQTDIESIVLLDRDGDVVINSSNIPISILDLTSRSWYLDAQDIPAIYHFSSPHIQDIYDNSNVSVITVTKQIEYYDNGNKNNGVLVLDINISNIITLTETTNLGDGGHIVILNDDDSLIYTNNDLCDDGVCPSIELAKDLFGGEEVTIEGQSMYANVNTLSSTRWRMATFINTEIVRQTSNQTLLVLGLMTLSTIAITILVSYIVSNRISSPINRLKTHMQAIEQGDFYDQITIEGQKEVQVLAHSFNSMIEEIKRLLDRVVEEQRSKRRTEFVALQNQINPHFLYNTLDSIVYLSEHNMNDKVAQMVIALSRFFRISISRGENIIRLEEELEHARNYLLIQQIRYHEKFTFEFDIEDGLQDVQVVKLSLQPLIENAIYHGINTEYGEGKIIIRAYRNNNCLVLEVEDNGYGMEQDTIEELYQRITVETSGKSVGMRNVYQRLKLYYGEDVRFEILSELDESTTIRISIPRKGDQ